MNRIGTFSDNPVTLFTTANGTISCIANEEIAAEFVKLDDTDRNGVIRHFENIARFLTAGQTNFLQTTAAVCDGGVKMTISFCKTPLDERTVQKTEFSITDYEDSRHGN